MNTLRRFPSRPLAFTLVELLLVIAIISILLAMTSASIGNLGMSRRLVNAGNLVTDLVNQARQSAKSRNSLSMLVLTTSGTDAYRALTILEMPLGATAWKQVSKWELLPEGIIVGSLESAAFVTQPAIDLQPLPPTLKRGSVSLPPASYAYQVFLPDGSLLTTQTVPPALYLKKTTDKENPPNFYKVIINPNTGTPIIQRP